VAYRSEIFTLRTEKVQNIIDSYKLKFHHLYVKARRYVLGGKISIYRLSGDSGCIMNVDCEEGEQWVYYYDGDFVCSCLDYFFNIVMKKGERRYCTHIIACMMYMVELKKALRSRDGYDRTPVDVNGLFRVVNKVSINNIIKDDILKACESYVGKEKDRRGWHL